MPLLNSDQFLTNIKECIVFHMNLGTRKDFEFGGAIKTSITSYLKTKWAKIGCISLKIKINILALLCPSYPTINKVPVLNWSMFVMQTLKLLLCSLLKHYSLPVCLLLLYFVCFWRNVWFQLLHCVSVTYCQMLKKFPVFQNCICFERLDSFENNNIYTSTW